MVKLKDLEKYKGKNYKLIDILNYNLVSKVESKPMYKGIINCTTKSFRERNFGNNHSGEDKFAIRIDFAFNARGEWTNKNIRTSMVSQIIETDNLLKIYTANSIYIFETTEKPVPVYQDSAQLIELFINDEMNRFCKGFYYDENKEPHMLDCFTNYEMNETCGHVHIWENNRISETVCRFYIHEKGIEFYDTLYHQQDYSKKMLIHNTADNPITISFQFSDVSYVIAPGGSIEFMPPKQ